MASNTKKSNPVKLIAILLGFTLVGLIVAIVIQTREPVLPADSTPPTPPVNLEELKTKAEGGDATAQNLVGEMYAKGDGVPLDYKEATRWYRMAADQGHAVAQKHLADLYEAGQGVPQNEAEAFKWCQRAAEQGLVTAQYAMAVCFAAGRGVKLNDPEAVKWYRKAAEQGDSLAQYNLGDRYSTGRSVPKDLVEAYKWLSLAAAQGIPDAVELRDQIKGSMTGEQLAEGQRRLDSFVAVKSNAGTK